MKIMKLKNEKYIIVNKNAYSMLYTAVVRIVEMSFLLFPLSSLIVNIICPLRCSFRTSRKAVIFLFLFFLCQHVIIMR